MLELESDPYSMFIFAMNAPQTREKYTTRLKRFFDFIDLSTDDDNNNATTITTPTIEERCKYFVEKAKNDQKWLLNNVLKFLLVQKERVEKKEITGATVRNYVKTIKLFCEMSDLLLPWKKITRGLPKGRKYADDRAPTIEEIRKIIEYPDRRIKAIVYTMTSSGIRLGAWDYLQWGHIKPVRMNNQIIAAKIIVYAGEEGDEYFSFITPEAYYELEKWMSYRKDCGENIDEKSWVMRNIWNTKQGCNRGLVDDPKKLQSSGIKRLMEDALWTQGLRKKLESGKRRHEFQTDHGSRKWFQTRCEISGMKPINIQVLMGHSTGISDSYYRATASELVQDYLKAIDYLTISNEHILQMQVTELIDKTKNNDDTIKSALQEKEEEIRILRQRDSMNTDAIANLSDQLMNESQIEDRLKDIFIRFRDELSKKGISLEMRLVTTKVGYDKVPHDRFIIAKNIKYNVPPFTTIVKEKLSEIKRTTNNIPFERYWGDKDSLDIVRDWMKIKSMLGFQTVCSNCHRHFYPSSNTDGVSPVYCNQCRRRYQMNSKRYH